MKNDLLLRTLRGEKVERPPVWMMRQAGRILPEYRALREKVKDFKTLIADPELVCEVTLQPLRVLHVDASILFSDILVIPEAMGLPFQIEEGRGPWFEKTINTPDDLRNVKIADPSVDLNFVEKGIRLIKNELNGSLPLIGFAGAPWTIFAYMIEGKGSKTFSKARTFLYRYPEASHTLLQMITESTIRYLQLQTVAGVDCIQLFDSWAGILSPQQYEIFALPYMGKIMNAINNVPKIIFAKGAYFALSGISALNCDAIGLDWNMGPVFSRNAVGNKKILQGNLDPCVLFADRESIRKTTLEMLEQFGEKHIANLGHGVYPDTDLDSAKCFVDTIRTYSY